MTITQDSQEDLNDILIHILLIILLKKITAPEMKEMQERKSNLTVRRFKYSKR